MNQNEQGLLPKFLDREPLPGDIRRLAEAERICFPDPWPERYFAAELTAPARFQRILVDSQGTLVAYLFTAWQYLDLHILKVATIPEVRRLGLGRRLMEMAEAHTVEMCGESVTLEVRPSNHAAIALYRSLGYVVSGERPGYYASGETALIMTKVIGSRLLVYPEQPSFRR